MADVQEDCVLCSKSFSDPVTLGCHHSFCSACLRAHWDQRTTGDCPECKRRWSKELPPDFSVKEQSKSISTEQTTETVVKSKHPEDVPTATDKSLRRHDTEESEQSEWLQSKIQSLREKKELMKAVEKNCRDMYEHSKKQAHSCETQIRAQFNRFHQFLKKEEEASLSALREEQKEKARILELELERVHSQLTSLYGSIYAMEKQLQQRDFTLPFDHINTQLSQPVPELRSGLLIDHAKILGNLGFRVWRKMRSEVHYSPVILDPNTANCWLYLSKDLTSVRHGETQHQPLPHNPERFNNDSVLGSEAISSGRHQWDVEVGDHPEWKIGLASESTDRKELDHVKTNIGFWFLNHYKNKYLDTEGKTIKVKRRPDRIRVLVDYDRGEISFHNVKDMTEICVYKDTFVERIFPYFCVGKASDAKNKNIVICAEFVKVEFHNIQEMQV